jgi:hypothetical protein
MYTQLRVWGGGLGTHEQGEQPGHNTDPLVVL